MQMKRILGILLALCFLMSVTAAVVGASGNVRDGDSKNHFKKFEERYEKEHFKKNNEFRFNEHGKKKHFHPGHREFRNNRYIVVYEIIKVYKIGHWSEY